ncbi:MAG: signal peptide peptidase SppA [Phycisphaerae bacterium]|nr:signal peptide peptidase SppA [Phycisphaerae bacterium]
MRRTLLPLIAALFLTSSLALPTYADEGKSDEKKGKKQLVEEKAKDKGKDKDKPSPIKKLVELRLDPFLVPARAINIPMPGRTQTIRELLERLEKYAEDDEVGAILLNLDGLGLGLADIEELRAGIASFRKADKKVFAFLNAGGPMGYLLACQADEIAIAPTGDLAIPGIGHVFPFMRGMYQMRGIEYDVITAGRFKYPGFVNRREPNKYFLEEFGELLDGWFKDYVKFIADGRGISPEKVEKMIDIAYFRAEEAKNRGLVDAIGYYDDYCDRVIRRHKFKKASQEGSDFAKITSLNDLLSAWQKQVKEAQKSYTDVGPKIAVLHARGPIIDSNLGPGFTTQYVMRDEFVKSIEQIRKNKTVRAVVLHIDSPGGSGYASDVIWQKLRELDEEKPLVVSMGTVAGSGGYYIACPGRLIFAQPTTLTGSIGVIGILANRASAYNRMDVNLAEMKHGDRALLGYGHRDMRPEDRDFIQKLILDFYEIFLDRVAATRKMPKDEVRKIAEGRIYTGRQALEIGLIDRLGGLKDAIAAVRDMADIPASAEIKLVHYPRPASIGELVESFAGLSTSIEMMAQAQMPAPPVTFDSQLRFFAQSPKPLCWMALPDANLLLDPMGARQPILDLLGLPTPQRPALPVP